MECLEVEGDARLEVNIGRAGSKQIVLERATEQVEGFDGLYERYGSYVYNTCLGILCNVDDARDAVQETFVQLCRSLPSVRDRAVLRTWLYRVAVNKCMDALRKRQRSNSAGSLDWFSEDVSTTDDLREALVRQAISRLKPQYRAVLVLYYFEELSYNEIAESLQCNMTQVRVRLHRARKAFRRVYDDGGTDDEM